MKQQYHACIIRECSNNIAHVTGDNFSIEYFYFLYFFLIIFIYQWIIFTYSVIFVGLSNFLPHHHNPDCKVRY